MSIETSFGCNEHKINKEVHLQKVKDKIEDTDICVDCVDEWNTVKRSKNCFICSEAKSEGYPNPSACFLEEFLCSQCSENNSGSKYCEVCPKCDKKVNQNSSIKNDTKKNEENSTEALNYIPGISSGYTPSTTSTNVIPFNLASLCVKCKRLSKFANSCNHNYCMECIVSLFEAELEFFCSCLTQLRFTDIKKEFGILCVEPSCKKIIRVPFFYIEDFVSPDAQNIVLKFLIYFEGAPTEFKICNNCNKYIGKVSDILLNCQCLNNN